ncbi:MAG: transcriptional regulator, partial [Phormidesmis sp. CAN_BIN44]|nr:transcriptional regulator [Phormidesmis sp. CAN_BIN44]
MRRFNLSVHLVRVGIGVTSIAALSVSTLGVSVAESPSLTGTIAQSVSAPQKPPTYVPVAPPPLAPPLPSQRQQEDRSVSEDYRVSALQPDYQGNLWVGSWQGLAKINPNTGKILSRISIPNRTIGALAQDKV